MSKVKLKWNERPRTAFKEHLNAIKVTIIDAPSQEDLGRYFPAFADATWQDEPTDVWEATPEDRMNTVKLALEGKILPTVLETVSITFRIEGLDLIDVTHLIRHRVFSFSAQCTADRDMRWDDVLVKPSIIHSPDFYARYKDLMRDAKKLYADMVDCKEVSIFDARTVLPRALSNFYYVRGNIKDLMNFINTRKDEAIQPESDNVIAIRLYQALVEFYPLLADLIEFGGEDKWFTKTAQSGHNSMAYMPKEENDVFEHTPDRFIYQKRREDFPGGHIYMGIREEVVK